MRVIVICGVHSNLYESRRDILKKTLFLGYGNKDRQDDGVAWHILANLAKLYEVYIADEDDDIDLSSGPVTFMFTLQLYPELSEELVKFDQVIFIDAHTGAVPEDIHIESLDPNFSNAPLTHHMTPGTLLFLTQTIYQCLPAAVLVSVRGYEFEFVRYLSSRTAELMQITVEKIYELTTSNS